MRLCYTDRSKDDVELAFAWYEKQRRGGKIYGNWEVRLIHMVKYIYLADLAFAEKHTES